MTDGFKFDTSLLCRASFPAELEDDGGRCIVEVTAYRLNAVPVNTFLLDGPRPSGATTPSMRSGPASARNTATASGGPSSLRWLRKEVGAREVQVRRLRALLECEHIPADPPRRLHLPAL